MDAKCTDEYLFHRWTYDYTCSRCGASVSDQGTLTDVTLEDDQFPSAVLGQAHPVDQTAQRDSHQDFLDSSSPASAESHEKAWHDLPAFLRRQG